MATEGLGKKKATPPRKARMVLAPNGEVVRKMDHAADPTAGAYHEL